jgi:hypothetical protein
MAQLYADENFPLPVVEELRRLGHDVLTIFEDGKANQQYPDASVLQDATADERVVLTLNRRHFRRLHETIAVHAGMILCTYDPDFLALAQRIHEALAVQETLRGRLVRVNRPSGSANSP